MDKDLRSYVKVYDNWLDAEKCKQTIREMNNINWEQHTI